jgi:long-chain acyl-CoA synthetase
MADVPSEPLIVTGASAAPAASAMPWLDHYQPGTDWDMPLEARPVPEILERSATRQPASIALDFLGKQTSYAELMTSVDEVAAGLQRMGLVKGGRVGLLLPNTPFYVIMYFAILKAGGIVVNINPLYAEREIANLVADSGLEILVTLDLALLYHKVQPLLGNALSRIIVCRFAEALPFPKNLLFPLVKRREVARIAPDSRITWFSELCRPGQSPAPVAVDPENDVAVFQYTGGTTGIPKAAMLTHANVYINAIQSLSWFGDVKPGQEVMMGVLPFFHVFAMTASMNLGLVGGAKLVLLPRFDLGELLKAIDKHRVTLFPAVPSIYNAINHSPHLSQYDLSSVKLCISGGAPLPVEVRSRFMELTGCKLVEGYGLSETSPVACCNPLASGGKAGSIGLPLPGTVIEIVSLEDHETRLGIGEIGEICIRGPQVMKGYWNRPDATAESLRNGFMHSGDVGYMDEEGYTFIVDRLKDMILVNGYNVYPRNIEEAIYLHEAVEECIAAGVKDEKRGEVPKVWIKLKQGRALDAEGLRAFLADKLSPIELPRHIEFRDTPLPKTLIGKLSRKDILQEDARRPDPPQ